ncbi:hypothetical protein [Nocardiopsis tropica]|uniref:ABC transporter substrate-binding protein n=1 Tax=Nocardiopsis tropica TaxID=109330 RepID=A0ABU7KU06_9ACTN|nr:hypothetical protein [Nocardiopsis umidischolae]MEE2052786.1 hypothetical protein [Nocardiopsis umidischolae]
MVPRSPLLEWWRRWRRLAVPALVLLLLVPAALYWNVFTCGGPASGVRSVGGQCVGVTDGGYVYHGDYTGIQASIAEENARVAAEGDGHVVRVALLGTLTFGDVSPMDPVRMRRSLEGAYTAQMRANHTRVFSDNKPGIQLLLANMGSRQEQWEPVVDDLVEMAEDETNPLVAVIGMGVSIDSTRDVAARLNEHDISMVSSAVTADGLEHDETEGLMRAAPSNTEYVRALRRYLDGREGTEEPPSATLVYDATEPDLFVTTLRDAYEDQLDDHISGHPQEYVGTTVGDTPQAGLFETVTQNVCASENDTVLFAGRAPDLDAFLESLAYRSCLDRPLRVLFVATGLTILNDREAMARLEEGNTTLVYASAIDPRWGTGDPSADVPPDYASFVNAFHEYGADPEAVPDVGDTTAFNNGYALVNHDAFAVAATAIRMTNRMDLQGGPPTASMVGSQLMLLNNAYRVPAGGGVLNYSDEYGGEAAGRYVPVVEVPLEGDLPLPAPYVIGAPGGP